MSARPVVDSEFRASMQPLSDQERQLLEESILSEGCRDALVTWTGILLDGHNRLEICEEHGIPYATIAIDLPDREAAADWIDCNQLGRRNLTADQYRLYLGRRYNRVKKAVPNESGRNQHSEVGDQIEPQPKTADKLARQHGVSAATVKRAAEFARQVDSDPKLKAAILAGKPAKTANGAHVGNNSGENEWYTPANYIALARSVMGDIDLDPASHADANKIVKAKRFYTAQQDGLAKKWQGRVWMNPPYAQPLIGHFSEKLAESIEAGDVTEAICLVNNATETRWFQRMASAASAVCFPAGRVKFWHPERESAVPLQGQAVMYFGTNQDKFSAAFEEVGVVCDVV